MDHTKEKLHREQKGKGKRKKRKRKRIKKEKRGEGDEERPTKYFIILRNGLEKSL